MTSPILNYTVSLQVSELEVTATAIMGRRIDLVTSKIYVSNSCLLLCFEILIDALWIGFFLIF